MKAAFGMLLKMVLVVCAGVVVVLFLFYLSLIVSPVFEEELPDKQVALTFPADVSLGELWLYADANCFTCETGMRELGEATGVHEISVPYGWYIELQMPEAASSLIPYLSTHVSLQRIDSIRLNQSDVTDVDLRHLKNHKLRLIDLRDTKINGSGLKYLSPNPDWTFVELQGTKNLDLQKLTHFRDWQSATVSLTDERMHGYDENDRPIINSPLFHEAWDIICGSRGSRECLQVR